MIKNNLLAQILIGLLVVFLLIGSIQMFGWGQGLSDIEIDKAGQSSLPKVPKADEDNALNTPVDSNQLVDNIKTRPVFSEDRAPFIADENPEDGPDGKEPPPVIDEIKAKLTGIVITPENSYAMILDNVTNKRETYKIGMPLDGEQGGWTLTEIENRKVVFVSDDDKTQELELEVLEGGLKVAKNNKGKKNKKNNKNNKAKGKRGKENTKALSRNDKKKNADDIRKKIAERRAQMRADAAKKSNK